MSHWKSILRLFFLFSPVTVILFSFATVCCMVSFCSPTQAAQVTLAWDANTDPAVAGYKLYYGYASRAYGTPVNVGNVTQFTLSGIEEGKTSYFAVTAYDTNGNESAYSTELECFTLVPVSSENGTVSPASPVIVSRGMSQTFTITPATNYSIADVLVDATSAGSIAAYTFSNVDNCHSLSAMFAINSFDITASAGANGSISPSGSVSVVYGSSQTFSITPNTGYKIVDVQVDGGSVGAVASYTLSNVNAAHVISATFAINSFDITASAGANGSISPSGSVSVVYGSSQTFSITPNTGYKIVDVQVDGGSVGAVTSYALTNVKAVHTISATFDVSTYTIIASAGSGGSITPSGTVTVKNGVSQTFAIKAYLNYKIKSVLVDGVSVGAVTSYTFRNVQAKHTIAASFISKKLMTSDQQTRSVGGHILAGSGVLPNGGGSIEVLTAQGEQAAPAVHVDWPEYNRLNGEMHIATGDIDGDEQDEIIVGLGPVKGASRIPDGYFIILDDDYSVLGWGQVEWPEYNAFNGETRPACGDLDNDGMAEIIIGLGPGGEGRLEVFKFDNYQIKHGTWLQTGWSDYNTANGETRPACGDLNGDGKDEIVIGLGPVQDNPDIPGGVFFVFDTDMSDTGESVAIGSAVINWPDYNRINGESWPACGDINGDGKDEIVLGLGRQGAGRFEILEYDMTQHRATHLAWQKSAVAAGTEIRPVCGQVEAGSAEEQIIIAYSQRGTGMMEIFAMTDQNFSSIRQMKIPFTSASPKDCPIWPGVKRVKD